MNLLTVRKYSREKNDYLPVRTGQINDAETKAMIDFFSISYPFKGYYKYTVMLGKVPVCFYCWHSNLEDYIKACNKNHCTNVYSLPTMQPLP